MIETIEQILSNLKKDPEYYNFANVRRNRYTGGITEEMWLQECQRDD